MTTHSVLNVRAAPEWGNSELYKYYERNGLGYGTVQRECMRDVKLRCPPSVDITRDPETEDYIRSFQDHLPPNIENEKPDVIIINTPPHFIEDSDSDVICLD